MEFGFFSVILLIICGAVFYYSRRHFEQLMDEHDIAPSATRKLLVLSLACMSALIAGQMLGWLVG